MSRHIPKVSVLMSVYNGDRYLEESLNSILDQTFTDFEVVIIDDNSSDETQSILSRFASKDCRIRLSHNSENIGLTKSLNKGLRLVQGEYIARQDADDISMPTRFEKQVTWLNNHPETTLISAEIQRIRPNGTFGNVSERSCPPNLLSWHLLFHNHLGGHSQVMFRCQSVLQLGGYNEAYRYSQDYELWCRLAQIGELFILPEVLLHQRFHSSSISSIKRAEQNELVFSQVARNIEQLTGKVPLKKEVENLHCLWSTNQKTQIKRFPPTEMARLLNRQLCYVYLAYATQQAASLQRPLRALIAQKFLDWANRLSLRKQLLAKLQIYWFSLCWSPQLVVRQSIEKLSKKAIFLEIQRPAYSVRNNIAEIFKSVKVL